VIVLVYYAVRTRLCKACGRVIQERSGEPIWPNCTRDPIGKRLLPHRPCYHCGAVIVTYGMEPPTGYVWPFPPPVGATLGRGTAGPRLYQ
jgi:hypothetical protein